MAIVRKTPEQISIDKNELAHLNAMADDEIDYSDIPPLSDEQIAKFKPIKQQVTIRLDSDVLAWLKKDGKGYQTRANELLRQMMLKELQTPTAQAYQ